MIGKLMIEFSDYPLPPSVNAAYWATGRPGVKASSQELIVFKNTCWAWYSDNAREVRKAKATIDDWLLARKNAVLRVDSLFVFHRPRLFLKDGGLKTGVNDVDNRVKPLRDTLSKILELNDSLFWSGYFDKLACENKEDERAIIQITPYEVRTYEPGRPLSARSPALR